MPQLNFGSVRMREGKIQNYEQNRVASYFSDSYDWIFLLLGLVLKRVLDYQSYSIVKRYSSKS